MRILLIITCLANIAFAFGSLPWLPDQVAPHFNSDGMPTRLEHPIVPAVIMSVVVVFTGATILGASWLMTICPPYSFNIPNRDYWLSEENRPKTILRIRYSIELIGVGTMLFFLLLQWKVFQANQTVPPKLDGNNIWVGACVLLIVITVDTVRLLLSFRLPKENNENSL